MILLHILIPTSVSPGTAVLAALNVLAAITTANSKPAGLKQTGFKSKLYNLRYGGLVELILSVHKS